MYVYNCMVAKTDLLKHYFRKIYLNILYMGNHDKFWYWDINFTVFQYLDRIRAFVHTS